MNIHSLAPILLAAIFAVASTGCESSDDANYNVAIGGNEAQSGATTTQQQTQQQATASTARQQAKTSQTAQTGATQAKAAKVEEPTPATEQTNAGGGAPTVGDAIGYGALQWKYGGFKGGGAKQSSATISSLHASGNGMSYKWAGPTLSSWGLGNGDASSVACLFVQNNSGSWVGGKFDYISTSRTSRDFKNINSGYGGWNLSNVPNPCQVAFVIVSGDGKKRTNVIVGSWKR